MLGSENRTRNSPPPGKKRVGDWKGMRVRVKNEISNGYGSMPAGSIFTVRQTTAGLTLQSDPCTCCGFRMTVSRVASADVEPAAHEDAALLDPNNGEMLGRLAFMRKLVERMQQSLDKIEMLHHIGWLEKDLADSSRPPAR